MNAEQEPGPETPLGVERAAVFRQTREGALAAAATDPLTEKLDVISLKPAKATISVKMVALARVP